MSGFVLIYRTVFDHPVFQDFNEASAFVWMVTKAAWKQGRVRYKDRVLTLERGQLAVSLRDLSDRFGWGVSKVRRFLAKLENERMIDTLTDTGVTVITLCNYDDYQLDANADDTPADVPPTCRRHTADTQIKEGNEVNEVNKKTIGGAGAQPPMAFMGKVIRLNQSDYDEWRKTYRYVPDFDAELKTADCYYSENPPKDGKWFFPVSNWLKKAHEQNKPKPRFGL